MVSIFAGSDWSTIRSSGYTTAEGKVAPASICYAAIYRGDLVCFIGVRRAFTKEHCTKGKKHI
jgi:hypothetical protein